VVSENASNDVRKPTKEGLVVFVNMKEGVFIPILITVPYGDDGRLEVVPHTLSFKVYGPGREILASGENVTAEEYLKILNGVHAKARGLGAGALATFNEDISVSVGRV
jgi:hypothetical protein